MMRAISVPLSGSRTYRSFLWGGSCDIENRSFFASCIYSRHPYSAGIEIAPILTFFLPSRLNCCNYTGVRVTAQERKMALLRRFIFSGQRNGGKTSVLERRSYHTNDELISSNLTENPTPAIKCGPVSCRSAMREE